MFNVWWASVFRCKNTPGILSSTGNHRHAKQDCGQHDSSPQNQDVPCLVRVRFRKRRVKMNRSRRGGAANVQTNVNLCFYQMHIIVGQGPGEAPRGQPILSIRVQSNVRNQRRRSSGQKGWQSSWLWLRECVRASIGWSAGVRTRANFCKTGQNKSMNHACTPMCCKERICWGFPW